VTLIIIVIFLNCFPVCVFNYFACATNLVNNGFQKPRNGDNQPGRLIYLHIVDEHTSLND